MLLVGLAPGLSGCALINSCTYEERSVTAFNAVIENGEATLRAEISVNESRGSLELRAFTPNITGTLKGHVTSVILTNTADPSFQLSIPVDRPESPAIASGILIQTPGDTSPDLAGLYERIAGNGAVLEVTTYLASPSSLTIPLTVTQKQDWFRPRNCY